MIVEAYATTLQAMLVTINVYLVITIVCAWINAFVATGFFRIFYLIGAGGIVIYVQDVVMVKFYTVSMSYSAIDLGILSGHYNALELSVLCYIILTVVNIVIYRKTRLTN